MFFERSKHCSGGMSEARGEQNSGTWPVFFWFSNAFFWSVGTCFVRFEAKPLHADDAGTLPAHVREHTRGNCAVWKEAGRGV